MATSYVSLKCAVKWLQIYEPEEYSGDIRWIGNFYPVDGNEWEKFQKSGLQQIPKEDEDGKFIRFRRSLRKMFPKDDEATYFNPPKITGAVNVNYVNSDTKEEVRSFKKSEKIVVETVGEKVLIGNGSVVTVNLVVFDSGKGKGHRLESIVVHDLVVYEKKPVTENETKKEAETTEEKPTIEAPTKTSKSSKTQEKETSVKEDMNDTIPW